MYCAATLSVVDLAGTFTPSFGDVFTIINNDGGDAVTGTFNGAGNGTAYVVDGSTLRLYYNGGAGNNDVVLVSASGAGAANLFVNNDWTSPAVVDGNLEAAGSQTAYVGVDAWDSTGNAFTAVPGASQPFNGVITINGNTSGSATIARKRRVPAIARWRASATASPSTASSTKLAATMPAVCLSAVRKSGLAAIFR